MVKILKKYFDELKFFIQSSKFMLWIYIPALLILVGAMIAEIYFNIPMSTLTRDSNALGNLPFYFGWISDLGILLWAASASIALFSSQICIGPARRYLLSVGLLFTMLLLDDFLMFHDGLFPLLGLDERILFLLYAIAIILIIKYNGKFLMEQNYWILLTAVFFLAVSLAVDVSLGKYLPVPYLFEDGSKFLGIVGIFGHVLNVSWKEVPKAK